MNWYPTYRKRIPQDCSEGEEKAAKTLWEKTKSGTAALASKAKDTLARIFGENKKLIIGVGVIGILMMFVSTSLMSCSTGIEGVLSAFAGTTYPSETTDIHNTNDQYSDYETDLNEQINNIESTHPGCITIRGKAWRHHLFPGQKVTVQKVIREEKSIQPPKLYDLTSLQRDANKVFGFTAARTLELTQGLYEKKLVTYPRTDSQYLTDDMGGTATAVIQAIEEKIPFATGLSFQPDIKMVQNSKKVSDHHAIIPTVQIRNADLAALSSDETKILYMIADRLLAATSEKETYESVRIVLESEGKTFTTAGRHILHDGFHAMELAMKHYFHMDKEPEESEEKDSAENAEQEIRFPVLSNGQDLGYADTKVTEHFTQPPKYYTENSLLSAMERAGVSDMDQDVERKGLGTPATRASIIEKLVSGKFVTRQKKQLIPTEDGMKLIEILPESLKSAKLTAEWENELLQMEKGQCREQDFMNGITGLVSAVLAECSEITPEQRKAFGGDGSKEHKEIGTCPICGSPVYEGKKNFYCSNRDCDFALWKENRYLESMKKTIDEKTAEALLKHGRCHVKGLYSKKTGKTFEADLLYSFIDGKGQFGLDFSNNPKPKKKGESHD